MCGCLYTVLEHVDKARIHHAKEVRCISEPITPSSKEIKRSSLWANNARKIEWKRRSSISVLCSLTEKTSAISFGQRSGWMRISNFMSDAA